MIPKKIHYCWFGRGKMPEMALECIDSWHRHMHDWEYVLWNEDNFNVDSTPYTKEAYLAGKYAFVSDYVRLYALANEGGIYLDVDFLVYQPFDKLLHNHAFAGFEGSKHKPVMMGVCASEAHGQWITEMLDAYNNRFFLKPDGLPDLTTNVQFITSIMASNGFRQDGAEQDYRDLHIYPTEYFSPRLTTGEYIRTGNTYCEHRRLGSWHNDGWKGRIERIIGPHTMTLFIKLKRKIIG